METLEEIVLRKSVELGVLKKALSQKLKTPQKFPTDFEIWNARQRWIDQLIHNGAVFGPEFKRETYGRPEWEACATYFQEWIEAHGSP